MKNLPIHVKILFAVVIFFIIKSCTYNPMVELYNLSKSYELEYNSVVQKQITNYDGYYQAFTDKQANANINKEVFVQVTNIIMSNRKDGQTVAWKWVTENQQIPYEEFTIFYKELSAFISERYKDNMIIEEQKQSIAQRHNFIIAKYPNNMFNYFIGIDPILYKAGYVSESTKLK